MAKTKKIGTVVDGLTIIGTKRVVRPTGVNWKYLVKCDVGHVTEIWPSTVLARMVTCAKCKEEATTKTRLRINEESKKRRADARKKKTAKKKVFRDVRNGMTIKAARERHGVSKDSIREKIADIRSANDDRKDDWHDVNSHGR